MSRNISQEQFDKHLDAIATRAGVSEIMSIAGVYEIVSEHFNNQVIESCEKENHEQPTDS